MLRFLVVLMIFIKLLSADTQTQKPSELEVFLFKIGFEALLKDVDSTKQRSQLNEDDIKVLKDKIKLIMNEVYKDKTSLENSTSDNTELIKLKKEIEFLKKEIIALKSEKILNVNKVEKEKSNFQVFTIGAREISIYKKAITESEILGKLKLGTKIKVNYCDNFGWCKLHNQDGYVRKFLLN